MGWLALVTKFPLLLFRKPSTWHEKPPRPHPRPQKPRLCTFDQLPKWYQDNPYIVSHYRPVSESYPACLHSLTYLHNETANIYTHLVPALFLALALPLLQLHISALHPQTPWPDRLILSLTPLATLTTLSLSTTYHTLMNHSPHISSSCLLLDYTGILTLILASFLSGIYVAFYDSPAHKRLYTTMILLLVTTSCTLVLHPRLQGPRFRPHRTAAFVLTALSGLAPVFHGMWLYGADVAFREKGVRWWLAEGAWYGVGAFVFARRVPERWAFEGGVGGRGRFDVWGASHQVFHVCVVVGAGCHCWGVWEVWGRMV